MTAPVSRQSATSASDSRERQIDAALRDDGRPLDRIGVFAHQRGRRWEVEILSRADFLDRLDARGRDAAHESDRAVCKDLAAWARGLRRGQCPDVFISEDGTVARGTVSRATGRGSRG